MFQIKNFNSIVASMINNVSGGSKELTDFNTGSVVRTILEAAAAEIDQYYQSLLKGFYEAVPVSIYKSFSFNRLEAVPASGYVTFTRETGGTGDINIPAGTRVTIPGADYTYVVDGNVVLENGLDTVEAYVVASTAGSKTNCLANTIIEIVDGINGIASVTNADGFSSGQDQETDSERKLRFQRWLNTLARSTRESVEYGAGTAKLVNSAGNITEQVKKVVVHEACVDDDPIGVPGNIDVYIWNGVNGASTELIQETNKILYGYTNEAGEKIPGWKAAGIIVNVYSVIANPVDITATVTLDGSRTETEVDEDIKTLISSLFQKLEVGETLIWSKLVQAVMDVSGVLDVSFTTPTANVSAGGWNHICSQGTISLTYI